MSRKVNRVRFQLDTKNIKRLPHSDIRTILRAADPIIMTGGRNLLAKILKGSREKKVLELNLDCCPVYGAFRDEPLETVKAKIDWMIKHHYLETEYDYRLPLLVFSETGWEIEKDTYSDELLQQLKEITNPENHDFKEHLQHRDRGMILLLLNKIEQSGNPSFIPSLREWKKVDYKKVRKEIDRVIHSLSKGLS
ncbi:RQC-minor-1 family DNA-binding protein [Virgibacillus siamensis]|uniref:RQC-minor-1 family DNA-binding protein n=1 Tax=Virgibacillus siamensis TaxID=480071 RepID=UPI0009875ABF|nr:RQC-minor-1 family DNA-binding protein [Virgibacillus siamensis]